MNANTGGPHAVYSGGKKSKTIGRKTKSKQKDSDRKKEELMTQ